MVVWCHLIGVVRYGMVVWCSVVRYGVMPCQVSCRTCLMLPCFVSFRQYGVFAHIVLPHLVSVCAMSRVSVVVSSHLYAPVSSHHCSVACGVMLSCDAVMRLLSHWRD